jgi:DNA-binding response OmpR family regulator
MIRERMALHGMRVLVVEDMFLVAEAIADLLTEAGACVVGPMGRIGPALAAAQEQALDGALLDVNLGTDSSLAVAEALRARGIPFIFLTGYSDLGALPPQFRDAPRVVKPFRESELTGAIAACFQRTAASTPGYSGAGDASGLSFSTT